MWMDKGKFRAWMGVNFVLSIFLGFVMAQPLKPKVIAGPADLNDKRTTWAFKCYEKIIWDNRQPDHNVIMDNCTKNALLLIREEDQNEYNVKDSGNGSGR